MASDENSEGRREGVGERVSEKDSDRDMNMRRKMRVRTQGRRKAGIKCLLSQMLYVEIKSKVWKRTGFHFTCLKS